MTNSNKFNITADILKEEENDYFLTIAKDNFYFAKQFFIAIEDDVLVAKSNGEIIGGVILKSVKFANKKVGIISWIFTVKEVRGKGVASLLLDKAINHLKFLGHNEIIASIDGSNTSSSNLFSKKNFAIQSFYSLIKKYGIGYFSLASKTNQFFNQGSFIWVLSREKVVNNEFFDLIVSSLINILASIIIFLSPLNFIFKASLLSIIMSVFLLHLVRFYSMKYASKVLEYKTMFRIWPSGFFYTITTSVLGLYIASPGNFFPESKGWKYKDYVPSLSKISIVGVSSVLFLVLIASIANNFVVNESFSSFLSTIKYLGLSLVVFDLFLFFNPFNNTNGKRIFDFSKSIFSILVLITLIAIFL